MLGFKNISTVNVNKKELLNFKNFNITENPQEYSSGFSLN